MAEDDDMDKGGDAPLIDLNEAAVKKLLARAKKRGYLTYDELNAALPQDQMSSEQIEDIMSAISDMGVNIVESDEDVAEEAEQEADDEVDLTTDSGSISAPQVEKKKEIVDRTDDPVRMYLREMGAVELLSREGEIAIAKRIEAGRNTMIAGLCESPLTFQAITIWRDELLSEDILLRDVIDLEATFGRSLDGEEEMDGPALDEVDVDAAAPRLADLEDQPLLDLQTTVAGEAGRHIASGRRCGGAAALRTVERLDHHSTSFRPAMKAAMPPSVAVSVAASSSRFSTDASLGSRRDTGTPPRMRLAASASTTAAAGLGSRTVNSLKKLWLITFTPGTDARRSASSDALAWLSSARRWKPASLNRVR